MKVKRIQRKRAKGWKMPPNTIYVGRPSEWGNPYKTGDKETDLRCYENELIWYLKGNGVSEKRHLKTLALLRQLRGKDLACWCKEDEPCHADVLIRWVYKTLNNSEREKLPLIIQQAFKDCHSHFPNIRWSAFGVLWEFATKEDWWDMFYEEVLMNRKSLQDMFRESIINPERFANAVYKFLEKGGN